MSDTVRVLRLLEYTGPREAVEKHFKMRGLKGSVTYGLPGSVITIREGIIGEFPEVVERSNDDSSKDD